VFSPGVRSEFWAFTIVLSVMAISGLFLIRDWMYETFGVYGVYISTPADTREIHLLFAFIFVIVALIHLAMHMGSKKKPILPINTRRDFKDFIHSGMYLIGLSRREDIGAAEKYNGRQRITYMALLYILGLAAIT
jgi:Ni,Fe-hydrogenase I cytochrome b subunit